MFRYLPEQASDFAADIDWIHNLVTDLSVFFTVAIVGAMIYFAIRYRQRDGVDHETPQIHGSNLLEIIWTVVPTLVCIYLAYYGIVFYREMRAVPDGAITIDVRAQKWKWDFYYGNGKQSSDLVVPVGKPIKLVLSSRDVLHSFFLPSMRVKKDAVPGQYTYLWFRPIKTGEYQAFCTEYCGKDHSAMLAKLYVLPEAEYERWVNDRSVEEAMAKLGPTERGKALYKEKACVSCHTLDGSPLVGPTFLNIIGRKEKWTNGVEYTVDENYIHESILEPNKHIVAGYQPNVMPSFAGQLNDEDINSIIAFMRTLTGKPAAAAAPAADTSNMTPAERGKALYQAKACIGCHTLDGSPLVGPTFKGLYGTPQKLSDGTTVNADDAFLKESIQQPQAHIIAGYEGKVMPPMGLSDDETKDLIEFMKTLK
ncbi:MAG: cytochrome c oxidase subunit II [Deltaproteobacteria bacterium]|nr:cytochrome c oxidase subunit II [Deltaproteobacteria bacterium]